MSLSGKLHRDTQASEALSSAPSARFFEQYRPAVQSDVVSVEAFALSLATLQRSGSSCWQCMRGLRSYRGPRHPRRAPTTASRARGVARRYRPGPELIKNATKRRTAYENLRRSEPRNARSSSAASPTFHAGLVGHGCVSFEYCELSVSKFLWPRGLRGSTLEAGSWRSKSAIRSYSSRMVASASPSRLARWSRCCVISSIRSRSPRFFLRANKLTWRTDGGRCSACPSTYFWISAISRGNELFQCRGVAAGFLGNVVLTYGRPLRQSFGLVALQPPRTLRDTARRHPFA